MRGHNQTQLPLPGCTHTYLSIKVQELGFEPLPHELSDTVARVVVQLMATPGAHEPVLDLRLCRLQSLQ